ncbi:MAG: hypothetical protein ACKO7A_24835, partial [Microcystis sp.]
MFNSFREYLHQFALSVDIVDRDILANIREILWQYLHKSLSLQFAEELHPTQVNNKPGLKIIWGKGTDQIGYSNELQTYDGRYQGQTSYAYVHNKPMWIVNNERLPLNQVENY